MTARNDPASPQPTAWDQAGIPTGAGLAGYGGTQPQPEPHPFYLVLRLGERRVDVMSANGVVASFAVAIGREEYPTPIGRFAVTEMVENPTFLQFDWDDPSRVFAQIAPGTANPLGSRWIGFTSAHGWRIGFHGTPQPQLIGLAVSHGCVRLREKDIVVLSNPGAASTDAGLTVLEAFITICDTAVHQQVKEIPC